MNFIKMLAVLCALAIVPAQARAQAEKKTEPADLRSLSNAQLEQRKIELTSQLKAVRAQLTGLKADAEQSDLKIQRMIASAKTPAMKDRGRMLLARNRLSIIRDALQIYYCDKPDKVPSSLADLVPSYLDEVPELDIPGYKKTGNVTVLKKANGAGISNFVANKGGWLYMADPAWGQSERVFMDARVMFEGKALFQY